MNDWDIMGINILFIHIKGCKTIIRMFELNRMIIF